MSMVWSYGHNKTVAVTMRFASIVNQEPEAMRMRKSLQGNDSASSNNLGMCPAH